MSEFGEHFRKDLACLHRCPTSVNGGCTRPLGHKGSCVNGRCTRPLGHKDSHLNDNGESWDNVPCAVIPFRARTASDINDEQRRIIVDSLRKEYKPI